MIFGFGKKKDKHKKEDKGQAQPKEVKAASQKLALKDKQKPKPKLKISLKDMLKIGTKKTDQKPPKGLKPTEKPSKDSSKKPPARLQEPPKKEQKSAKKPLPKSRDYRFIRAPLITEKATRLAEKNQLLMEVAKEADKKSIKEAVESLYEVDVKAVNTFIRKGKRKTFRGVRGKQVDKKCAIITLQEGQSVDLTTKL